MIDAVCIMVRRNGRSQRVVYQLYACLFNSKKALYVSTWAYTRSFLWVTLNCTAVAPDRPGGSTEVLSKAPHNQAILGKLSCMVYLQLSTITDVKSMSGDLESLSYHVHERRTVRMTATHIPAYASYPSNDDSIC